MSALPSEVDMLIVGINVCYVPTADIGYSDWVSGRSYSAAFTYTSIGGQEHTRFLSP
jgi:hypothetical protein